MNWSLEIDLLLYIYYLYCQEFEMEKAISLSRLPEEPDPNDPNTMQVMLRLPTGHRMERWFRTTDLLQVCLCVQSQHQYCTHAGEGHGCRSTSELKNSNAFQALKVSSKF